MNPKGVLLAQRKAEARTLGPGAGVDGIGWGCWAGQDW